MVGEMQLERRDARQGSRRSTNLRGEVRKCREVVSEARGLLCEPVSGQLHPIARVTGESDDDLLELFDLFGHEPISCDVNHCGVR